MIKTTMACAAAAVLGIMASSCSTTHRTYPTPLDHQVTIGWSQNLLREVVTELSQEAGVSISLDARLSNIADVPISFVPTSAEHSRASLAVALDYIRNFLAFRYEVQTRWEENDGRIVIWFAGTDEDWKKLPKGD